MTRLHDLYERHGQSPWLDNLRRSYLRDGTLAEFVDRGVRGVTSNPSIFQKAIAGSDDYDDQFAALLGAGSTVEDAYWTMVVDDIVDALAVLAPVHAQSGGRDGYVSVEVDPRLARDTAGTIAATRELGDRIGAANLMVKIPATAEGLPAIRTAIAEGRSINVTLIFSLDRHREVMEAYLSGLEDRLAAGHDDLGDIHSVASFFISRVDSEVDSRLADLAASPGADGGTTAALAGRTAVAQGRAAYAAFRDVFSGDRWDRLAAAGANLQRPLWASTSTKNDAYPDTLYVDELIGSDTVNTLPEDTLEAFVDHGTLGDTVGAADADEVLAAVAAAGVDLDEVAEALEIAGVAAFEASFTDLLDTLESKAAQVG